MSTIHTVNQSTYIISVVEKEDHYSIMFNNLVTGRTIELDQSESKDYALTSADKFPELYTIAQNLGYTLNGDEFVNKYGRSVSVNEAFDIDRDTTAFKELLISLNKTSQ